MENNERGIEDWEREFDEKYKVSDLTYSFDTVLEINAGDVSELKNFIRSLLSSLTQKHKEELKAEYERGVVHGAGSSVAQNPDIIRAVERKARTEARESLVREWRK